MKKLILLLIIILPTSAICSYAQEKAKPDTAKAKYNYTVTIPARDYQQIAGSLNDYKRLQMYDPMASPDQKVKMFQAIEQYLKELPTRVKLDSAKVKK